MWKVNLMVEFLWLHEGVLFGAKLRTLRAPFFLRDSWYNSWRNFHYVLEEIVEYPEPLRLRICFCWNLQKFQECGYKFSKDSICKKCFWSSSFSLTSPEEIIFLLDSCAGLLPEIAIVLFHIFSEINPQISQNISEKFLDIQMSLGLTTDF